MAEKQFRVYRTSAGLEFVLHLTGSEFAYGYEVLAGNITGRAVVATSDDNFASGFNLSWLNASDKEEATPYPFHVTAFVDLWLACQRAVECCSTSLFKRVGGLRFGDRTTLCLFRPIF